MEIQVGDITRQQVDVLVVTADERLEATTGSVRALDRLAGPRLRAAARQEAPCPPGDAIATAGYRLAARWVVHAVPPQWRGGHDDEDELLASCYRRAFQLGSELGAASIAFPNLSDAADGFPVERAAKVALIAVKHELERGGSLQRIVIVLPDEGQARVYRERAAEILAEDPGGA